MENSRCYLKSCLAAQTSYKICCTPQLSRLGVYLSSTLDWSVQINDVCLKASRKLSVLRNVKCLKRNTLDMLYKIIIRSVIDYALPVYANNLKLTELAHLDRLQYKAGKLVCGALHYTSREKLNNEQGWENFHNRIKFLGLSLWCFALN